MQQREVSAKAFRISVSIRGVVQILPWVAIFLGLAVFYFSYVTSPLVRSYDTFFDLDQEIQIRRWLNSWEALLSEQKFHAEYIFRHPGGYYPRAILQPFSSIFGGPNAALAMFWAVITSINIYLTWVISGRLLPTDGQRCLLFLCVVASGAFLYANLTMDTFTLSLPLLLSVVNEYLKDVRRTSWVQIGCAALSTAITITNAGLILIMLLVRVFFDGFEKSKKSIFFDFLRFFLVLASLLVIHYFVWVVPLGVDLWDGVRRTYWVVANDSKSDLLRYFLTFFVYSGVPPEYDVVFLLGENYPFVDFRSSNYSVMGYFAASIWFGVFLLGVIISLRRLDPVGVVGLTWLASLVVLHYVFHNKGSVFLFVLQLAPSFLLILSYSVVYLSSKRLMRWFFGSWIALLIGVNGAGIVSHVSGARITVLASENPELSVVICRHLFVNSSLNNHAPRGELGLGFAWNLCRRH